MEKQRWEEEEERRSEKKKSQKKENAGARKVENRDLLCFSNDLWLRRVEE